MFHSIFLLHNGKTIGACAGAVAEIRTESNTTPGHPIYVKLLECPEDGIRRLGESALPNL